VPKVDLKTAPKIAERLCRAVAGGLVASCHDCSEGGLAAALAEMAFAGGFGIEADLRGLPAGEDAARPHVMLFSESTSRYIVEVRPDHYDAFARLMLNLPFGQVGRVTAEKTLVVKTGDGRAVVELDIETLRQAWKRPLQW
jgi:phosphoribosylformylglycinamidine synthase